MKSNSDELNTMDDEMVEQKDLKSAELNHWRTE